MKPKEEKYEYEPALAEGRSRGSIEDEDFEKLYLRAIKEYRILPNEKVNDLAVKAKAGDEVSRNELVESMLRLAAYMARSYYKKGYNPSLSLPDMNGEACRGLLECIEKYDPKKASFSTYAAQWMKKYLKAYMDSVFKKEDSTTPFDDPVVNEKEESARSREEITADPNGVAMEDYADKDFLENDLRKVIGQRSEEEQEFMNLRLGWKDGVPKSLAEIAGIMKKKETDLRIFENRTVKKLQDTGGVDRLREFLASEALLLDPDEMHGYDSGKEIMIFIKRILNDETDEKHPITQEQIIQKLRSEYRCDAERKTIARNIGYLKMAGMDIVEQKGGGYYLAERKFTEPELRFLIDAVLSSRYISKKDSDMLIKKLASKSSRYFRDTFPHIARTGEWGKTDNSELFLNIDLIDHAISEGKKISFEYYHYDISGTLKHSSTPVVSPYQMVIHNQRYYLIGKSDNYPTVVHYRLERMKNMKILDKPVSPIRELPGFENGFDFKRYATQLPYMYSDRPVTVVFLADKEIIDQVIDWFGSDVKMEEYDDSRVRVQVKSSPEAMKYWALQYLKHVQVIMPKTLRKEIRQILDEAGKKYD